jgi:alkanesulfonate monooxygenase SsuD/methylene tetrahydromethanopterin reductase-like flavin-dependent oxidoreductase (luciferase family)
MAMKLGLAIGYSGAHMDLPVSLVQRAEELGYDSVWSAEAHGSDPARIRSACDRASRRPSR